jgi:hypothetical protein
MGLHDETWTRLLETTDRLWESSITTGLHQTFEDHLRGVATALFLTETEVSRRRAIVIVTVVQATVVLVAQGIETVIVIDGSLKASRGD